jgi:hypothetical protein
MKFCLFGRQTQGFSLVGCDTQIIPIIGYSDLHLNPFDMALTVSGN